MNNGDAITHDNWKQLAIAAVKACGPYQWKRLERLFPKECAEIFEIWRTRPQGNADQIKKKLKAGT